MALSEKRISIGSEESTGIDLLSGVPIQCVYVAVTGVRPAPDSSARLTVS